MRFMDTRQAAKFLNLKPQTLMNWRHRRCGPPYHRLGGRIIYDLADLEAYLARHRIVPEGQEKVGGDEG